MSNPEIIKIPKESYRGKLELFPGFEVEVVVLDDGRRVITEESMHKIVEYLES